MSSSAKSPGLSGLQDPRSAAAPFSATDFIIRSVLAGIATATAVRVVAVTNAGGVEAVGTVDIQPLVMRVNGDGQVFAHGVIHGCPYQRLQGGTNAVILDPQVGDIGIAVFANRDISSVIANKAESQPGSRRMLSWSDAMYIGGILNGTPEQYVQFSADGIKLHSPTAINLEAPTIQMDCETLTVNASTSTTVNSPTFTVNGDVVHNGNVHTTGNSQLDGSAIVSGGAVLESTLAVAGVAAFANALIDGRTGKDIGGAHEHDHGTMTSTGRTGIVI